MRSVRPSTTDEDQAGAHSNRPMKANEQGDLSRALRQQQATFDTIVAGVAHELNNPMTYAFAGVQAALRHLRARAASGTSSADDLTLVEGLDKSMHGLERMREIVRNLVTFAHGDAEKRSLVDVRSVLESAIQVAWHQLRHRARLEKNLAEVPPVEANVVRLGRVFLNLLVNAAEAIPEGQAECHTIRVVTKLGSDDRVLVEISDTGVGIPEDAQRHIFEPFFTTKTPGTGLGLSVAHGVVRDLSGTIELESEVGRGTSIRVSLPCAPAWRRQPQGTGRAGSVRTRVLVVDDDPLVGDAVALTLSDENDVTTVRSGQQALASLRAGERYDTVLCDLLMPNMTGMDLFAELVREFPDVANSMIFMTGGATTARARAFVAGVGNACIQKPIDANELRELVRNHAHVMGPRAQDLGR